jgi:hypothetical protein
MTIIFLISAVKGNGGTIADNTVTVRKIIIGGTLNVLNNTQWYAS